MIKELMRDAFDVNASDIHLTVGLPPMFRVNGVLRQVGEEPLRREDTYNMAMELMDDRRRTQFLDNGEADFSYEIENVCRFRVNVFKQSNCVAAALRLISNNIPSFEDLRLPDVISDLAMLPLHPEQPPQIYDGYQSVSPLPPGFLDRQPVYQLYTLMNRAILFGGEHLVNAQRALERMLAA